MPHVIQSRNPTRTAASLARPRHNFTVLHSVLEKKTPCSCPMQCGSPISVPPLPLPSPCGPVGATTPIEARAAKRLKLDDLPNLLKQGGNGVGTASPSLAGGSGGAPASPGVPSSPGDAKRYIITVTGEDVTVQELESDGSLVPNGPQCDLAQAPPPPASNLTMVTRRSAPAASMSSTPLARASKSRQDVSLADVVDLFLRADDAITTSPGIDSPPPSFVTSPSPRLTPTTASKPRISVKAESGARAARAAGALESLARTSPKGASAAAPDDAASDGGDEDDIIDVVSSPMPRRRKPSATGGDEPGAKTSVGKGAREFLAAHSHLMGDNARELLEAIYSTITFKPDMARFGTTSKYVIRKWAMSMIQQCVQKTLGPMPYLLVLPRAPQGPDGQLTMTRIAFKHKGAAAEHLVRRVLGIDERAIPKIAENSLTIDRGYNILARMHKLYGTAFPVPATFDAAE
jgi:hypothetical protein